MSNRQPKPRCRNKALDGKPFAYRQLWRVVDGAVFDALYSHPDYLTDKGRRSARSSINKRVVGAILGFAEQSARGRIGAGTPETVADRVAAPLEVAFPHGDKSAVSKWLAAWERVASRIRAYSGYQANRRNGRGR